jgi:hypothetical protein
MTSLVFHIITPFCDASFSGAVWFSASSSIGRQLRSALRRSLDKLDKLVHKYAYRIISEFPIAITEPQQF